MQDNDLAIDIRGVTKRFEEHVAVRDLSLSVPRGAVYGLLGPNGAGKTTTIRMILNIIVPDSGQILLLGQPHLSPGATDRIGYLPEERGLYKKMQVRRVLKFLAELKGLDGPVAQVKAEHGTRVVALSVSSESRDGVAPILADRTLVARADDQNRFFEIELAAGASAQTLLRRVVESGATIERFELVQPSL